MQKLEPFELTDPDKVIKNKYDAYERKRYEERKAFIPKLGWHVRIRINPIFKGTQKDRYPDLMKGTWVVTGHKVHFIKFSSDIDPSANITVAKDPNPGALANYLIDNTFEYLPPR